MNNELKQINAGTTVKLKIEITLSFDKTKFYTEETLNKYLTAMVEYYFTGDNSIIEDYLLDPGNKNFYK